MASLNLVRNSRWHPKCLPDTDLELKVNYTDLKVNVCLNGCLHFDQIWKGSYRTVEAYIFLQAVKLSYLRWHPKWPPENQHHNLFAFCISCCKIDTKIPHGSSKQML